MDMSKFPVPSRYNTQTSVWEEYLEMKIRYKPKADLGQGYPNFKAPKHVLQALSEVATGENTELHQYTRARGHPRLVKAIATLYSPLIGRKLDHYTEIIVAGGAYKVLHCAITALVNYGDEVIVIEPFFDCYDLMIRAAGGTAKFIPLKIDNNWSLDENELRALFNKKTKAIILNTPHNPTGKVFTAEELTQIGNLCKEFDVVCISDEVYEWLVYEPKKHIRIATLPGMFDRTITICSAGKTFSITGWKTGWAYGPANLIANMTVIFENSVGSVQTPIQEAIARSIEHELTIFNKPECYFTSLGREMRSERDFLAQSLREIGMEPIIPDGGYFMLADWTKLRDKVDLSAYNDEMDDYKFTKFMIRNASVQTIPVSAFFSSANRKFGEDYVRVCFIKSHESLQKGVDLLKIWKNTLIC